MSSSPLGTYDLDPIQKQLGKLFPNKKPAWSDRAGSSQEDSVKVRSHGFTFQFPLQSLWKNFRYKDRLSYACIRFLQPGVGLEDPEQVNDRIDRLRYESNLQYMDIKSFAAKLKEAYQDLGNDKRYQQIRLWIWRRSALVDYVLHPPTGLSHTLLESDLMRGVVLNRARRSLALAADDAEREDLRRQAHQIASKILSGALESAAQATCRLLGPKIENCSYWANFMLPMDPQYLNSPFFMDHADGKQNKERGDHLWRHVREQHSKVLVVVAETRGETNHFGFWVPVYSSSMILPGAPTAYLTYEGSAVFKDDLPPFPQQVPNAQVEEWRRYMRDHFRESLFVSLPYSLNSGGKTLAVFNINVIPKGNPDSWRRAYHRLWLRETRDQIKASLCQAYEAFQLKCDTLDEEGTPSFFELEPFPKLQA